MSEQWIETERSWSSNIVDLQDICDILLHRDFIDQLVNRNPILIKKLIDQNNQNMIKIVKFLTEDCLDAIQSQEARLKLPYYASQIFQTNIDEITKQLIFDYNINISDDSNNSSMYGSGLFLFGSTKLLNLEQVGQRLDSEQLMNDFLSFYEPGNQNIRLDHIGPHYKSAFISLYQNFSNRMYGMFLKRENFFQALVQTCDMPWSLEILKEIISITISQNTPKQREIIDLLLEQISRSQNIIAIENASVLLIQFIELLDFVSENQLVKLLLEKYLNFVVENVTQEFGLQEVNSAKVCLLAQIFEALVKFLVNNSIDIDNNNFGTQLKDFLYNTLKIISYSELQTSCLVSTPFQQKVQQLGSHQFSLVKMVKLICEKFLGMVITDFIQSNFLICLMSMLQRYEWHTLLHNEVTKIVKLVTDFGLKPESAFVVDYILYDLKLINLLNQNLGEPKRLVHAQQKQINQKRGYFPSTISISIYIWGKSQENEHFAKVLATLKDEIWKEFETTLFEMMETQKYEEESCFKEIFNQDKIPEKDVQDNSQVNKMFAQINLNMKESNILQRKSRRESVELTRQDRGQIGSEQKKLENLINTKSRIQLQVNSEYNQESKMTEILSSSLTNNINNVSVNQNDTEKQLNPFKMKNQFSTSEQFGKRIFTIQNNRPQCESLEEDEEQQNFPGKNMTQDCGSQICSGDSDSSKQKDHDQFQKGYQEESRVDFIEDQDSGKQGINESGKHKIKFSFTGQIDNITEKMGSSQEFENTNDFQITVKKQEQSESHECDFISSLHRRRNSYEEEQNPHIIFDVQKKVDSARTSPENQKIPQNRATESEFSQSHHRPDSRVFINELKAFSNNLQISQQLFCDHKKQVAGQIFKINEDADAQKQSLQKIQLNCALLKERFGSSQPQSPESTKYNSPGELDQVHQFHFHQNDSTPQGKEEEKVSFPAPKTQFLISRLDTPYPSKDKNRQYSETIEQLQEIEEVFNKQRSSTDYRKIIKPQFIKDTNSDASGIGYSTKPNSMVNSNQNANIIIMNEYQTDDNQLEENLRKLKSHSILSQQFEQENNL